MAYSFRSASLRLAAVAATVLGAVAVLALLRGNPVQAQQGPMSAPACQCSVSTPIPGMSSRIANCLCGAIACAVIEPIDSARGASQMQCVRQ